MKTFREFLSEEQIAQSGFGLPRSQMPQVKDLNHFVNYLEQLGISYIESTGDLSAFKPTQAEFNKWKVNNIKMDWRKKPESVSTTKSVLVSEDGFVLDGHHRYFAAIQANEDINYIKVDLPINKLFKLVQDYMEAYG